MSAVKERKSLSADTPRSWKPDFKPRDYPDYLNHVEQGYLQTLAKHVQEAIDAPSAFQGVAYNSTPRDEDHVLANDYKAVADPGDQALKPIDDTNKRLFRILYAAAQTYPFAKGTMDSAPYIGWSRSALHSEEGLNPFFVINSIEQMGGGCMGTLFLPERHFQKQSYPLSIPICFVYAHSNTAVWMIDRSLITGNTAASSTDPKVRAAFRTLY